MRVERTFPTRPAADAFKAGIEYVGSPDVEVVDVLERGNPGDCVFTVVLEDHLATPDDDPPDDMAPEDPPGDDAVE